MQIDNDNGWEPACFDVETSYDRIGSKRCFGVELEFDDLPCDVLDIQGDTVFGAKEDCSVDGGEFDSPILYGDKGLEACEEFCDLTDSFETGMKAGYHLHLDLRNEKLECLKRIALGYHYTHKLWASFVPSHRRRTEYSIPHNHSRKEALAIKNMEDFRDFASNCDRYVWSNWYAWHDHRTLEIRSHESTTCKASVTNWIIAHARFMDAMAESSVGRITRTLGDKDVNNLFREFRAIIHCPDISEHFKRRYHDFIAA